MFAGLGWAVAAMCLAVLSGCASRGASTAAKEITTQQAKELEARRNAADPFLRTQVDVGLAISRGGADRLVVRVTNKTKRPLIIGPKEFSVINPPARDLHAPLPTSAGRFPVLKLQPGEEVSGELIFAEGVLRKGSRLAFHHPEAQSAMAEIPAEIP